MSPRVNSGFGVMVMGQCSLTDYKPVCHSAGVSIVGEPAQQWGQGIYRNSVLSS